MPKRILIVAVILLIPLISFGQKRPLSLEEAVALGIRTSPGLHASQMKVESSAARTRETVSGRLPSLKFGAGYARLSRVPPFEVVLPFSPNPIVVSQNYFDNYSLRVGVQQPLFTGFRLEAGTESARDLEQSAGLDLEKDRSEFVLAVKTAYWGLARAREFEGVIDESINQVREHLKDVKAFFDQGLLTKSEVLRGELQLSNAEIMKIDARNAIEIARTSLDSLIGLPLETDFDLTTSAEAMAAALPQEGMAEEDRAAGRSLLDAALSGRPELRAADFRIMASEAGVKASKSGLYPQVFLLANYYYLRPNQRLMPAKDKFYGTWDIGIAVSYDLWNWGQTRSQTEQAKAQLAQARDARKLLEDQAVLDVTQSRLALTSTRAKVKAAGLAVAQAEENLRTTRERFKQGVALNTEVLDAEVFLLQAKMSRAQTVIDLALAQARLEKALGR
jgi:outer membrane protein TolC